MSAVTNVILQNDNCFIGAAIEHGFLLCMPTVHCNELNNRVDMLIDSQDEGGDDDDDEDDEAYTPTDIDSEEGDSSEDYSEESDWSGEAEDSSGKSKWHRYTDVPVFVELLGKLNSLFKLIYSCVLHLFVCQDNDTNIPPGKP